MNDTSTSPQYKQLQDLYGRYFSLRYLGQDINTKFALISLVSYMTYKLKQKRPDVTHYQVLMNITKDAPLPDDFIKGLAVVCEDFSYGVKEFPTFNIKPENMVKTVKEILLNFLPF